MENCQKLSCFTTKGTPPHTPLHRRKNSKRHPKKGAKVGVHKRRSQESPINPPLPRYLPPKPFRGEREARTMEAKFQQGPRPMGTNEGRGKKPLKARCRQTVGKGQVFSTGEKVSWGILAGNGSTKRRKPYGLRIQHF